MLSESQIERYSRQIILPQLGGRGQEKLLSATVAVVGGDRLGITAATYLAAAGVGRLVVAAPRVQSEIEGLNPDCQIAALPLSAVAIAAALRGCTAALACGATPDECTVINSACIAQRITLIWGHTLGTHGWVTVLAGHREQSPCYACVAPHVSRAAADDAANDPLADATAAFIGTLQATATIEALLGLDVSLATRLLTYDAAAGTFGEEVVGKDPHCAACGERRA